MEGNEKEDGSNQWKEQLGVIFDECNMPVELTAKEIHHIMNELYRTWEEKKYFAYLRKLQVPTDKKVKDLSKGMRFRLSRSSARWKQEGFVVDHASIEDILLYIVKRDEVRQE